MTPATAACCPEGARLAHSLTRVDRLTHRAAHRALTSTPGPTLDRATRALDAARHRLDTHLQQHQEQQ